VDEPKLRLDEHHIRHPLMGIGQSRRARVGSYTYNTSKTGYKANTSTGQIVDDQTTTIKIILTKNSADVPGYPSEAILIGISLIMGYFSLIKDNKDKMDELK
jgi:hypothetical protein